MLNEKKENNMTISLEDFKKIDIKIGEILSAEKVPETDKLLKLAVDFGLKPQSGFLGQSTSSGLGDRDIRQIISGISTFFPDLQVLVGKKCAFVANLEPRTIKGLESQGMILAVSGGEGSGQFFSLLESSPNVSPGVSAK